jgi:hypothetical protein
VRPGDGAKIRGLVDADEAHEAHEVPNVSLVGAAGAGVVEARETLELGGGLGEAVELGGGEAAGGVRRGELVHAKEFNLDKIYYPG